MVQYGWKLYGERLGNYMDSVTLIVLVKQSGAIAK